MKPSHTIEILPKSSFANNLSNFEQSPSQAVDIHDFKNGSMWARADGLFSGTDTVTVVLRTSNINDDSSYVDSGTSIILTDSNPIQMTEFSGVGRFVRVAVQPAVLSGTYVNVQVILHMQRS